MFPFFNFLGLDGSEYRKDFLERYFMDKVSRTRTISVSPL